MHTQKTFVPLVLSAAIALALVPGLSHAQTTHASPVPQATTQTTSTDTPPPPPPPASQAQSGQTAATLDQIVVTGVATFGGERRKDTSYSITTATREQIKEHNPVSVADLLKISPGIYPESSGGQTGANIEVAGFPSDSGAPFVTFQINGVPMFPAWNYFNDALFRLDDTIERVELVQGGPSVLYGNGQPGLISNFILRQGTAHPSGDIGLTYGFEGKERIDGFYGFPIGGTGSSWFGSIGGFWRRSDGVRDPQFDADKGGQLTATISHTLDNGSLLMWGRVLKDKNQFVTDTPILNPGSGQFKRYPTFDPLTGTFSSNAIRHLDLMTAPCYVKGCQAGITRMDLANGEGANVHMFGIDLNLYFDDGWSLSNKAFFMGGEADINAIFSTGANPTSLGQFITDTTADFGLPSGLTAVATYPNGDPVPMDTDTTVQNPEFIPKHLRTLSDELRLSKELFDGNTLTFGAYAAFYGVHHRGWDGNNILLQTRSNPLPIRVHLTDGVHNYFLTNQQGLFWNADPQNWMALNERWHSRRLAVYIADQWHIGRWRFSGGLREDQVNNHGWVQNRAMGDLDANPYTVYNNHVAYLAPSYQHFSNSRSHMSWTIGANYAVTDHLNMYARVNNGVFLPRFNDVRGLAPLRVPIEKIHNMEVGAKYQSRWLFASVSAYRRLFYGIPYSINLASGQVNLVYGSQTKGLNAQIKIRPFKGFTVALDGNYMDGEYSHHQGCVPFIAQDGSTQCVSINGMRLSRQPKLQFRLTPAYAFTTDWGRMKFWITYEHVGNRFGDRIEQQPLGSYHDIAVGALADVGRHWMFTLRGTNVTNQIGITEGNARLFGFASGGGVILARSIAGREVNFQVKYKFGQ